PNDPSGPVSIVALAAEIGSAEIAELLVAHGADPAWVSRDGWNAATFADANDFTELAERLVELGAPVESRLAHGYSHLHRAAGRGRLPLPSDLARSMSSTRVARPHSWSQ